MGWAAVVSERMSTDPTLAALRAEIDALDRTLIDVVAARREAVERIAAHKRSAGLPPIDPSRESAMLAAMTAYAARRDVPEALVHAILSAVLTDSRRTVAR